MKRKQEVPKNSNYLHNSSLHKGINTPSGKRSVKQHVNRQGPIGMHCDAPKWVLDPFPSVMASVKTSKQPLDARCVYSLRVQIQPF